MSNIKYTNYTCLITNN